MMYKLLIVVLSLLSPATALQSITNVTPSMPELQAFYATVQGVIDALTLAGTHYHTRRNPIIHVLGASAVEDSVEWHGLCVGRKGARLVLVGPDVVNRPTNGSSPCVSTVKGVYSRALLHKDLQGHKHATPDAVVLLNADVYVLVLLVLVLVW